MGEEKGPHARVVRTWGRSQGSFNCPTKLKLTLDAALGTTSGMSGVLKWLTGCCLGSLGLLVEGEPCRVAVAVHALSSSKDGGPTSKHLEKET